VVLALSLNLFLIAVALKTSVFMRDADRRRLCTIQNLYRPEGAKLKFIIKNKKLKIQTPLESVAKGVCQRFFVIRDHDPSVLDI
jgi:hypothetical protein